ncbi:hypothetical protein H5410_002484 [Solanum commersonii]|uniref:Uncharacterized protein n=1 Tax=Solanum commersonii TaxID=4109 RepID=A0A9J6B2Z1_SOLCO|nr:hypothetical protein H5410_002484 [Solanum commersonii]
MEQRALSVDELLQKVHLAMEFEEVIKNEEIAWRQRSRIQWLKNGDKNTKYFHRMATTHKRCNTIDKIEEEGTYITDPEVIKIKIQDYYQNLYKETETWRPNLNLQDFTSINLEEQIWLQRQFEEEEVLKGINLCASDKAPGPDGFPMSFFKEFWSMQRLANILGCKIEQFPTTYLGMPAGSNHKELLIWDGIIQRSRRS